MLGLLATAFMIRPTFGWDDCRRGHTRKSDSGIPNKAKTALDSAILFSMKITHSFILKGSAVLIGTRALQHIESAHHHPRAVVIDPKFSQKVETRQVKMDDEACTHYIVPIVKKETEKEDITPMIKSRNEGNVMERIPHQSFEKDVKEPSKQYKDVVHRDKVDIDQALTLMTCLDSGNEATDTMTSTSKPAAASETVPDNRAEGDVHKKVQSSTSSMTISFMVCM
ncbi:hypothetical protein KEM54_005417 [Ascosphaera aggregata]|nr:hypothetical protein KEM54_005417 [Ascosphaera aggregata]